MRTVRELLIVALLFFIGTLALLAVDKRCADMSGVSAACDDLRRRFCEFPQKQLNYSGIWVKIKHGILCAFAEYSRNARKIAKKLLMNRRTLMRGKDGLPKIYQKF